VAITASSGDVGYGTEYPAASPYMTGVGGTSLSRASNAGGWTETVWSGAGSGCSTNEPKPSFQTDTGCSRRTIADVPAVANPSTRVAAYDTYGTGGSWLVFGGTSVASPIIASVYAMATPPAANAYPVQYPSRQRELAVRRDERLGSAQSVSLSAGSRSRGQRRRARTRRRTT
jgi:subtilase family serine protease